MNWWPTNVCNLRHMKQSPGLCSNVHYTLLDHYSWLDHKCGSPTSQIASKKSGLSLASSVSSQPMAASCQSTDRQGCSLLAHTSWPDVCESRVQVSPLLAQLGLKWCNNFCCLNGTPSQSWPPSWVISQLWLLQRNPHGCCYSKEIQKTNVGVTFYG